MRVAVLMGGGSAEREVSLETGAAIAAALRDLGHDAFEVDVDRRLAEKLAAVDPEAAFLALHGRGGEDGTVQGLLEIMRIPYTGCGVLASALTMDKAVTKELLAYHCVPVVEDRVLRAGCSPEEIESAGASLGFPLMVKPVSEGSSIGVVKVEAPGELASAVADVFERDERAMLERFIDGRLLTVGIVGLEPVVLPVLEIVTTGGFYDYEAKYRPGRTEYKVPAPLEPGVASEAGRMAYDSFEHLRCEGISRVDLMLENTTGALFVLEVNTIPGMTASSLLPKAAGAAGMGFNDVVAAVLSSAGLKIDIPG